jgi:hypothetical protein
LIGYFQNQIIYDGDSLQYIENLSDFVFNMIYENYQYVDSVLYADSVAEAYAGNHTSTIYYGKFWEIAKNFTIGLFQKASHRLACVIYTEWINAGGSSTVISDNNNLLANFTLLQNYPNPFNPSTKIKYSVPMNPPSSPFTKGGSGDSRGGFVTLKVYDILGNEIETLVNEEKPAGTYEITWYAEQLSSGVYFYQFRAVDPSTGSGQAFIETRKMLLLK